jgi:enoyl-CoA hydratase/carnithine racemase
VIDDVGEGLRVGHDGPVASVVLDRPGRRNALTAVMWEALPALVAAATTPGIRVVVVRSAVEGVFCAGADVAEYRANAGDVAWGVANQRRVAAALGALRDCPLPTVAAVDGPCVGGGSGIALACDFRLASTRSRFSIPPARLGLVFPVEDTAELVDLVGIAAARRILLTGGTFDADWAGAVGFVDEVHPPEDLDGAVTALCEELSAVSATSVRHMKRILALVSEGQRRASAETDALVVDALAGPDHHEGVRAFLERRAPRFDAG